MYQDLRYDERDIRISIESKQIKNEQFATLMNNQATLANLLYRRANIITNILYYFVHILYIIICTLNNKNQMSIIIISIMSIIIIFD